MKILVADKFEKSGIEGLKAAGCEVLYEPDLKDDALTEAIQSSGADVLVVRSTKVTAPMMDAGRLSLIVRAGAGYNTIDVAAASTRGIYVSNCPGKNAIAVAELAFALILSLDRRVPDNVAELRAGKWNKKEYSKAQGLYGKTLGLLGGGSIGQEMIRRAAGFGLDVVIWSRRYAGENRPTLRAGGARARPRGGVPRRSRSSWRRRPGTSPSAPTSSASTSRLEPRRRASIEAELLARMKPGAMFINTARGEVVDHAALAAAVREKKLRVGLDVFANEPSAATGDFSGRADGAAERLRHAPHRRLDRPGAGSDRGRNGARSSAATRKPGACRTS